MSPYERFLRWYTGRQIPKAQISERQGWYPQDAPVLLARKRPLHVAAVDEPFLVRGTQGRYPVPCREDLDAAWERAAQADRLLKDR